MNNKISFSSLFGTWRWNSPPWVTRLHQQAKNRPKQFWGVTFFFFLLFFMAGYGGYWYSQRPHPHLITAWITPPSITPNVTPYLPSNLIIDFGTKEPAFTPRSVAPIALIGKTLTKGIEITPEIAGVWSWTKDSQLVFMPSEDWPAGQKYTLHFAKDFFTPNAPMESWVFSFSTLPFETHISEFKFYQDPTHSDQHQAIATLAFNFPVDPEKLEKNTSLFFQTTQEGKGQEETLPFSYTYDEHKRTAYLHSKPIEIKETPGYLVLSLSKKLGEQTQQLLIPDTSAFLKVISSSASIVRNEQDQPEQVLTVETSLGINEKDFNQKVHVYLLPKDYPASSKEEAKPNYSWQNPGEITPDILSLSTSLNKKAIPSEHNYATLHSFTFREKTPRYLYIKIDKGMKGFGDFTLATDYTQVLSIPELPKEIRFLHLGSLLALSGEKKLSVLFRGLPAVRLDFARLLPENINQLVTQTQGNFNNPYFINPSFNQQNITQIIRDIQPLDNSDPTKQQYLALDLGKYLPVASNPLGPQGLFLLTATGWDPVTQSPLDVKASRLVLITDLALLVKDNQDGSHEVFISSITQGTPVEHVKVTVLGKNGLPLTSGLSDEQGRVHFPSLKDFIEDKEPTVYLASKQQDVSFIPFNNYNRQLNFSKFDVGGIYTDNQEAYRLRAYLFSDRGIYRPSDTVHLGIIVKQGYAQTQAAGLPLQVRVVDPRGMVLKDQKITLNDSGYMELDFIPSPQSFTGLYSVNLFLVKDQYAQNFLGGTSFRVSEFQPDRMRIHSSLLPTPSGGWSSPKDLKAQVDLSSLYGAPAANRTLRAKILLTPEPVTFPLYPDYLFVDPLLDPKKPPKIFSETLNEVKTNEQGRAEFPLHLERFEKASYQLTFFAEGFEGSGGRSVTTLSKAFISPLPYFIGYKPDGDLSFIQQNSQRKVHYIALTPQLTKQKIKDLRIQLISLLPVTSLMKKADGTYQYLSIIQSKVLQTEPFSLEKVGTYYSLPTQTIGNFALLVLDKEDSVLSRLNFSIVGASQLPLAKDAQLNVQLNQSEYKAGDDIALQITAPYTGSGLITLERDRVYAAQWFTTKNTSSLQKIHIPADFQGNGYVNVSFIRAWESPELFISPLSYSAVPFTVNHQAQEIQIALKTPKVARPGETLSIDYQSNKPGKIIVFAVDEGILQAGSYDTPDPLAFFFQKRALEVLTQQTVDQILPKFIQERELSAAGGDAGEEQMANKLNPFKRKKDLPVVYWSGIINTDENLRSLLYSVPDYFNGRIRVMAVAVSTDGLGSQESTTDIRGDFVINPNTPPFVSPGDEWELSATVANLIEGSGEQALVSVELQTSPELEILGESKLSLGIPEKKEQIYHFKLRAKPTLGVASFTLTARAGNKSSKITTTLSIRPAMPKITTIQSGKFQESSKLLDILQTFYPEYRKIEAVMSTNPLILVFGLQRYLENYPYACTEQLTSRALSLLALNSMSPDLSEKILEAIQMLSLRQKSDGSFSYWPGSGSEALSMDKDQAFISVYALHFLTEAKNQGFDVPNTLFSTGLSYLKQLASQEVKDLDTARIQAYAIYLLTRNELVTTQYLTHLHLYLQQDPLKAWQKDLTAVYMAATYQLLQNKKEAAQLIRLYPIQNKQGLDTDFYDSHLANAQYFYLVAKHFPDLLPSVEKQLLMPLIESMNDEINTLLSGYISLALSTYPHKEITDPQAALSLTEFLPNHQEKTLPVDKALEQKISIDQGARQIRLNNPDQQKLFYQLMQTGFDQKLPKTPLRLGIEIFREYRNEQNQVINETILGEEIEVHIQIRALEKPYIEHVVIEDLLPGGFEVVKESLKTDSMDFINGEDRMIFFGSIESTTKSLVYKIKAINVGKYLVPPIYAEAMYNPNNKALGIASEIRITEEKKGE